MSVRAAVTNLRCDQTRTNNDNATELRCLSEIQLVGDFDSVRAEAARSGWMRVRGREPWVSDLWFDICPACYRRDEAADFADDPSGGQHG